TFYESLQGWPEASEVRRIRCPRMAFVGTSDIYKEHGIDAPLGPTIHERRRELEKAGWHVVEIVGRDHSVGEDLQTVGPIVRVFLDSIGRATRVVRLETELGVIELEVDLERAPITARNFLSYAASGCYDGGSFFRTLRPDNQQDAAVPIRVIQAQGKDIDAA